MSINTPPVYDVRVIRLIKSTRKNNLTTFYDSGDECAICLGHFDVIRVKKLAQGAHNPLEAIQLDSSSSHYRLSKREELPGFGEENFTYPLYILRQCSATADQSTDRLDKFWSKKTTYTVVSRFHCDAVMEPRSKPFPDVLISRLKMERQNNGGASLSKGIFDNTGDIRVRVQLPGQDPAIETDVWVAFYDSLELGDIVGIAKGNSISAILEVQRHLYESVWVSNVYTYCGICKDVFHAKDEQFVQMLETNNQLLSSACLKYISTRFSVNHAQETETYLNALEQDSGIEMGSRYFVTGTADLIIDWGCRSEKVFLQIMRYIARSGDIMYRAFNDIITRIGIDHVKPIKSRTGDLTRTDFAELVPRYNSILALLTDPDRQHPWSNQLLKLLGTLHTMHDNCVMDDLSALLVPGVSALLDRICHLHERPWNDQYDTDIFEFLECWALLTNDISHLESQLVQHPELSPVRYFIPAMILQYEQRCVEDCAALLQRLDRPADTPTGYTFAPILIPSANENTSTRCILDPWHDDQYTQAAPLRILLPINELYQPWKIAHILCHEVAHYCGSLSRHREERLSYLTKSAAAYLLQLMDSHISGPGKVDSAERRHFLKRLDENIKQNYLSAPGGSTNYLSDISRHLPWATWTTCEDPQIWEDYQNLFLADLPAEIQLQYASRLNGLSINKATAMMRYCQEHIRECLIPICKECYADIVLILLLDCSFQDYYTCVFEEEFRRLPSVTDETEELDILELDQQHIDRLALVSLVISDQSLKGADWLSQIDENSDPWPIKAKEKVDYWHKYVEQRAEKSTQAAETDIGDWPKPDKMRENICIHELTIDSVKELLNYLKLCATELNRQIKESDPTLRTDRSRLQEMIAYTKETNFNWNEIRNLL